MVFGANNTLWKTNKRKNQRSYLLNGRKLWKNNKSNKFETQLHGIELHSLLEIRNFGILKWI